MIRLVPDEPGPEFKAVPFACDSRPARCPECMMDVCQFGQTPGLRDGGEFKIGYAGHISAGVGIRTETRCSECPWTITAPDIASAFAALRRHVLDAHPQAPEPEPGGGAA